MLEGVIFLIIWALLPFFWHFLMKTAGMSLFRLSIPSGVIAAFYAFAYVGIPILYFHLDEYRAQFVTDRSLILQVFIFTTITVTLMLVGCVIARHHFGRLSWLGSLDSMPWTIEIAGPRQTLGLLFILLTCIYVLFIYLSKIGLQHVALLVSLGYGSEIGVDVARSAMTNAFEGKYHWYSLFMHDLLSFATLALFAGYLVKQRTVVRILFFVALIVTMFSLLMTGEKAPFARFLVALFFVYVFVRRGGRVPIGGLVTLGLTIVLGLSASYIMFMGSKDLLAGVMNVFSRATGGTIQSAYHYLEFIPKFQDYLMGRSFPNPRGILPFEHFALTKEIMAWRNPDQIIKGVVGSSPTTYWAEMYANFGLLGVLVPPFFVGYALYLLNALVFKLQPSPLSIALIVWLIMHMMTLSETSLSNFFLDISMWGIILTFGALSFFVGRGVIRIRNTKLLT